MIIEIFKEQLMSWEVELQQTPRKVLLFLHQCAAHTHLDLLKNIHLEFLPPSTTSLVQPVDMGIVSNLRTYRGKVINESLKQLKTTY
jgi:hypothetical protein